MPYKGVFETGTRGHTRPVPTHPENSDWLNQRRLTSSRALKFSKSIEPALNRDVNRDQPDIVWIDLFSGE
jgi:hypothetical protein